MKFLREKNSKKFRINDVTKQKREHYSSKLARKRILENGVSNAVGAVLWAELWHCHSGQFTLTYRRL